MKCYLLIAKTPKYGHAGKFKSWGGKLKISLTNIGVTYEIDSDHGTATMGKADFRKFAKHNNLKLTKTI